VLFAGEQLNYLVHRQNFFCKKGYYFLLVNLAIRKTAILKKKKGWKRIATPFLYVAK